MTIVKHELRQSKTSFFIWTAAIGFLLMVCIFLYPEMKGEMEGINDMFSSMGSFTAAFGMDKLNFGTLMGFYSVECGNVLGLGGAFFAALCAVNILSKEERDKTAEFLLTHPKSCQPGPHYHRKTGCCPDSDYCNESDSLRPFRWCHSRRR